MIIGGVMFSTSKHTNSRAHILIHKHTHKQANSSGKAIISTVIGFPYNRLISADSADFKEKRRSNEHPLEDLNNALGIISDYYYKNILAW